MSDRLDRATANGVLMLLRGTHPARDDSFDAVRKELEQALVVTCKCEGSGYYYTQHVDSCPLASSITACDCGVEAPKWLAAELDRWDQSGMKGQPVQL